MTELVDYSGEFDPEFSHNKLTREKLLELLEAYSQYMHRMDAYWYLSVKEKWGNDEALDCDIKVLEKSKLYEVPAICDLLNIHGDDVATVMKYFQVYPWVWIRDHVIDIRNNNYAIFTLPTCATLFALEKEGREKQQCHVVCTRILSYYASLFNPDIKVTPLKLPPRENKDDICCQWEFKLSE